MGAEGQFHVVFQRHLCRVGCRKLFMCGDSSLSKTALRFGTSIRELLFAMPHAFHPFV